MREAEAERTRETKCSKIICTEHGLHPTKNVVHGPEWSPRFQYFVILLLSANVSKMSLPTLMFVTLIWNWVSTEDLKFHLSDKPWKHWQKRQLDN